MAMARRPSHLVVHETLRLVVNVYTSDEIVMLLSSAGFTDIRVRGGYHGGPSTRHDTFHVFVAANRA